MRYAPKWDDGEGAQGGRGAWGVWDGRLGRWAEAPRLGSEGAAKLLADRLNQSDEDDARWDRLRRRR